MPSRPPGVRVRRHWAIEPLKVCARGEETHYTPIAFSLYCKSEPNEVEGGRGPKYGKFCLLPLWLAPPRRSAACGARFFPSPARESSICQSHSRTLHFAQAGIRQTGRNEGGTQELRGYRISISSATIFPSFRRAPSRLDNAKGSVVTWMVSTSHCIWYH